MGEGVGEEDELEQTGCGGRGVSGGVGRRDRRRPPWPFILKPRVSTLLIPSPLFFSKTDRWTEGRARGLGLLRPVSYNLAMILDFSGVDRLSLLLWGAT